jgi:hypothetical protein
MEVRHARRWEGGRKLHLAVGFVGAVIAVEVARRCEHAVQVAHRDRQDLQSQRDVRIATEMADHGGEMASG